MKEYIVEKSYQASKGIASAVLACLGIGLLIQTIGKLTDVIWLIQIGGVAKTLFIPALGIGIALAFKSNPLVVISAAAAAIIGGNGFVYLPTGNFTLSGGEPVGAICAVLTSIWFGKKVAGRTNFDMLLVPAIALLSGGVLGLLSAKFIAPLLVSASAGITSMVSTSPLLSSIVISLTFAILILSPASSAALAIALQLDPTASAAALIGCSVQFTSFAILSIKENKPDAFFAQLFCTPKLQTPNIIRHPKLAIIPLLLSVVMSPIGVLLFHIEGTSEVAGMGLCAFVAPLYLASNKGWMMLLYFVIVSVVLPAVLSFLLRPLAIRLGWIKAGELKIDIN